MSAIPSFLKLSFSLSPKYPKVFLLERTCVGISGSPNIHKSNMTKTMIRTLWWDTRKQSEKSLKLVGLHRKYIYRDSTKSHVFTIFFNVFLLRKWLLSWFSTLRLFPYCIQKRNGGARRSPLGVPVSYPFSGEARQSGCHSILCGFCIDRLSTPPPLAIFSKDTV